MKRIIAFLTASLLLLSACSSATLEGAGKELEDTIANAVDADNKYVQMVKGGYRAEDSNLTYGDAFSAFFAIPRWNYFKGEDGQNVVEFTGDCLYADTQVKARIQFLVDEENGTFDATYLAFNEVPQNTLTLAAVIAKAFEAGENEAAISTDSHDFNEALCKGVSVGQLLGVSPDEIIDILGYPETMGASYLQYEDIYVSLDETDYHVTGISGDAPLFTVNGQSLSNHQEENIKILGIPDEEISDGDYIISFYYTPHYDLLIYVEQDASYEDVAFVRFQFHMTFDTDIPEDNDAYFTEGGGYEIRDSSLVGRWRSQDGGSLTLEETGIASQYFRFWLSLNPSPDYVTWEAYNGRLTLNAHRINEYYWIIGEGKRFQNGVEYATDELSMQADRPFTQAPNFGDWSRVKTSSTDPSGTWSEDTMFGAERVLTLNPDGTGALGSNAITWWTDESLIHYELIETHSFDYSVSDNMLTIFFSDGSRTYTRVGN